MLDFVEETLDQMPFFVQMMIVFALLLAVPSRRDHRLSTFVSDLLQKLIRIVRAIRNDTLKIQIFDQVIRLSNIVLLATGQEKTQWIAQSVYAGVDLGAEPAATASKRLGFLTTAFFRAPAAQGCARMTVLSSKILSISGSPAKC